VKKRAMKTSILPRPDVITTYRWVTRQPKPRSLPQGLDSAEFKRAHPGVSAAAPLPRPARRKKFGSFRSAAGQMPRPGSKKEPLVI
jgi:hypothetical protein